MWEDKFVEVMTAREFEGLDCAYMTCSSVANELEYNTTSVIPYFIVTVGGMLLFCMMSLSMGDCVRTKFWMGIPGIIVTALSCVTSFGIMIYMRVPLIGICYVIPFLMLGKSFFHCLENQCLIASEHTIESFFIGIYGNFNNQNLADYRFYT